MPLDVLQGLVEGSSAHPKISCDFRFALPISDHLASEFCLLWCEGWLASFVLPCGFGNGNPFSLPLPNHGSFKLGDCADNLELELLKGVFRFACGKGESFLVEGDRNIPLVQALDDPQKVLKIASESVDAVHMQRIPITEVVQASNQLWPGSILSTASVGEDLVQVKTIELPGCVLICAADTDVADLLSFHA